MNEFLLAAGVEYVLAIETEADAGTTVPVPAPALRPAGRPARPRHSRHSRPRRVCPSGRPLTRPRLPPVGARLGGVWERGLSLGIK
ncbi:hypothetical protein [Embleya sp. NPDC005575]|uniref:hypothetical protein n=1 Tax=Embleya sp. NPDC005575 TaxID=3156892 RepID=UPI0033B45AEB